MKLTDLTDGADPFVVTIAGAVISTDHTGPLTITHGRASADARPDAPTLTGALYSEGLPAWPVVGDTVTVEVAAELAAALGLPADALRRFTGRVTSAEADPAAGVVALVAAGPRARFARMPIGDTPWPAELDGARATRILASAYALDPSLTIGTVDPGTVTVIARDVDRQPAGVLMDELAAFTGGDLWQTRAGALVWRDALHRAAADPVVVLDASDVLRGARWGQSLDGLLTRLGVGYGLPSYDPGTGVTTQPEVEVIDSAAEAEHGILPARVSTPLATLADAEAYARDQVGRRSSPRWRVPALAVDVLRTLSPAQAAALLAIEPGALLEVLGLPSTGPLSNSRLWVEGWSEQIERTAWRLALAVTAYGLTGPAPTWFDVPLDWQPPTPPGGAKPPTEPLTWDDVPPEVSWLAAVGYWPGDADEGRWLDTPANVRWLDVHIDTEWNEVP